MQVTLSDSAEVAAVRRTRDGYMVAQVKAGRTGIQLYRGAELGKPEMDVVRVYRPADEVFSKDALRSFTHRPATIEHPGSPVSSENWRDVAVGMTGGEVVRDGEFVSVPLILLDAAAIEAVEKGKRELSWGYQCSIDWTSGTTASGETYDAVQRSLRGNHLAIVDHARAGPECRIGDESADRTPPTPSPSIPKGARPMADENTRAVVLDGLTIRTNDAGAEAIARLQRQLTDAGEARTAAEAEHRRVMDGLNGQIAALTATHQQAIEAKDGEIAGLRAAHDQALQAKDGEIAALRTQTSDDALDARVAARTALVGQAKRILGDSYDAAGKTDAAIRKEAVTKAMGAALIDADSKGDAFFAAAFETVVALAPAAQTQPTQDARPDGLRAALTGAPQNPVKDADPFAAEKAAWQRMNARDTNAWKNPAPEAH